MMNPNQRSVSFEKKQHDAFSVLMHNLHNLLTGVYFFSEYIADNALEEADKMEMAQEMFANVKNSIDICLNLYFAHQLDHPDGGSPESRHFNAGDLIGMSVQHYEILARKKNITLLVSVQDDQWIETDANLLQFIVENLLSNAIKFTPKGGTVTVTSVEQGENFLVVVEDTGKGIEPELQQYVFNLGMHSTYGTDNEKGGGMGLYLCKQIVGQLNGTIGFQSTLEQGSRFSVTIPLR